MANLDFILQGLSPTDDHFSSIHNVFSLPGVTTGIVASAFMNAAGANIISEIVAPIAEHVKVFIGVRNDVTTVQAIQMLVSKNIYPILVDTATQAFIFHPKVYMAKNAEYARLLVGSANATTGGLIKNIEAGIYAELDMHNHDDKDVADKLINSFEELSLSFPENVFLISPETDLNAFVAQGILIDQNNTQYRTRMRASGAIRTDVRMRMRLRTRFIPEMNRTARQHTGLVPIQGSSTEIIAIRNERLLWKSRGLTRRDLNIPTAQGTNPTGSMLLKKGDTTQDIDSRSYFREIVFARENWTRDTAPDTAHMERCFCNFRIIIKGVDYGIYRLQLSHNSRTDTRAYEQHNSMTQIHWGTDVKPLIAHDDLLDCILTLYAPEEDSNIYTLIFGDDE
ncbi:MAG: phospholipase D family protein [Clostridiales bacterium]|nr:phospholipase D family protein [Clostridiales bacterium]